MKNTRIIGIFGCEQMDLCIYLAAILENLHFKVLVIDNSEEQEIMLCIPKPEELIETVSYKGVDYGILRPFEGDYPYDYVLVNLGTAPAFEWSYHCDFLICTLECSLYGLIRYQEIIKVLNKPTVAIIRNYCPTYMQEEAILRHLDKENGTEKKELFLPLLEQDVSMKAFLQFEGYRNFKGISKAMERVLLELCQLLTEKELTELQTALRRGKRGDFY